MKPTPCWPSILASASAASCSSCASRWRAWWPSRKSLRNSISKKVEAELAELRRAHEEKVQQIRAAFGDLRQQVTRLETVAGPKARLTPEQLGQLRQVTATLGTLLQERGVAKPYPGIYMDITRLTGVSRSEDIRQEDFQAVMAFLENQISALTRGAKAPEANVPEAGLPEAAGGLPTPTEDK